MEWRLIKDGYYTGFMNMAIDEAMMIAHEKGLVPPTIRFYQWSPPAVSLGYFQDMKKVINVDICRKSGIDIVRRPTGGKAVLHDQELTYSFIINENHPSISQSILDTYKKISRALINGLDTLGIKADLVPLKEKSKRIASANSPQDTLSFKANCFSTPSQYEVQVDGKKIIGSAQVRKRGVVLQHGSLLLKLDRNKWFSVFNFPSMAVRQKIKEKFKATCIEEITKKKMPFSKLSNILPKGFEKEFNIKLVEGKLTKFEEKISHRLLKNKYITEKWNQKRQLDENRI